jgi:hypothetical protein
MKKGGTGKRERRRRRGKRKIIMKVTSPCPFFNMNSMYWAKPYEIAIFVGENWWNTSFGYCPNCPSTPLLLLSCVFLNTSGLSCI